MQEKNKNSLTVCLLLDSAGFGRYASRRTKLRYSYFINESRKGKNNIKKEMLNVLRPRKLNCTGQRTNPEFILLSEL